jgi:hypothetical protein
MPDDNSQNQRLSPYEQLEHALWANLVCMCDCCERCDEYPPRGDDEEPTDWAKIVAPLAQADGWTAPGVCFLLCPDCRAKGVDWQKLYTPPPCGGISSADREWFQRWLDSDPDRAEVGSVRRWLESVWPSSTMRDDRQSWVTRRLLPGILLAVGVVLCSAQFGIMFWGNWLHSASFSVGFLLMIIAFAVFIS